MQDVRPVSEVRWGDEQGIAIGDTEEIRFVSGIMRVEGRAERTEIAVDAVMQWSLSSEDSGTVLRLIADPKAYTRSCSVFRGTLKMSESGKTSGKQTKD